MSNTNLFLVKMNANDWVYEAANGDTLTVYVEHGNVYVGASLNGGARMDVNRNDNLTVAAIYAKLS